MSCEEEEESSMDEDDDMPGLESVSSSEYVSDEDSVAFSSEGEEFPSLFPAVNSKSPNYTTAKKWLDQPRGDVLSQIHVITIHLLSPFLYGCSHQTDKWLGWCFKVGLLQSDVNYNTGTLNEVELCAVYVLDKALEWCKESATKEGVSPTNLAELLQLAEEVKPVSKLPRAIHLARKRGVFISMLESVRGTAPKTASDTGQDSHFIETACLYVVSQTAEHVENVINESINIVKEHEDLCVTYNMKYDSMMTRGDELKEQSRIKECIAQYTTTVSLCPYNYKLYSNRAQCYIITKQHRAALADGLRSVYLKPDWSKGHLRYIQGLDGCGMTGQASLARKRYAQLFPGDDIHKLAGAAERTEPTAEDHAIFNEVMKLCKQASEAYQKNNLTNTTYWYEEVWLKIKKNTGWKRCMKPVECDQFLVSLHYIYGSALLGRYETVSTETSLPHFEVIMTDFTSVKFPAAYYAAGRAYAFLRQHSDAVGMAKLGLEMVTMSSACHPLYYPGTDTIIEDSRADLIEGKLRKLLQQCKITAIPDAVCRYANCLSYNTSSRIWSNHLDYRGHVTLDCNEDCAISYHPSCWRKCKTESEQNSDKDFLLTACITPDCCGFVNVVMVYDNKGAIKAKFEASAEAIAGLTKKAAAKQTISSASSSSSLTGRKTKRRKHAERDSDKPSPVIDESKSLGKEEKKKKAEADKSAKVKEKSESVKVGTSKGEGVKGGNGKNDDGSEKGEGVRVGNGKKEEGVKCEDAKEKMEDARRAEDSLAVIDRQREAESHDSAKQKAKKKKMKKVMVSGVGVTGGGGEKHWNELFTLPEREGMVGEEAATNESWRPDPQAPFQTPSHLKEAVQEFERSQVSGMGLQPNSVPPASDSVPHQDQQTSEDLEFIYSFFAEIFKTHGPLKPTDTALSESLSLLPDEKKVLIADSGGIESFLLQSPTFCCHEGLICLSEDSPVIADSITHRPSAPSPSETPPDEKERSTSSSTNGSSPRDTPTDSPLVEKKTVEKSVKTAKKSKPGKPAKTTTASNSSSSSSKVPLAGTGNSRVDKIENSGATLKPATVTNASNEKRDRPGIIHRAMQTARVPVRANWTMTDPIVLADSFKERYEMVLCEKIDLRAKLEESEDSRFKIQRDHKRELEKLGKTIRQEAKHEAHTKMRELEGQVNEEKEKIQQEKRDQADQIKSLKAEIKSLSDKADRLKKELTKRDQKVDSLHLKHHTETERLHSDRRKMEERLRLAQDNIQLAIQRAISAEVDLLQLRVENVMRPGEARLMEIDRIINHIPPKNDLHREWREYQEKLRTAIECFQMATEEQIQAVRAGRELSTMEKIPNPSVPLPAHLAFRGMPVVRPNFPGPVRMPMRGPPVPMGVRPMVEGQGQAMGFPGPGGPPVANHPGPPVATHPGVLPPHPMHHQQQPLLEAPVSVAAALPPSQSVGQEPPPPSSTTSTHPSPPSQPAAHSHAATAPTTTEGEHKGSKSSFDRIVEKLVPHYPNYSREDFKMILREVRRNNRNTLSGLSLDSIAEQVRGIIETRERSKGNGGAGTGGETKTKPRAPLPPVAQAPPPINTTVEYTDEWSCIICYEDMDANDSKRLMCGHRFHTECIKSWFKEQNTCPTCRNHALLPDEYPFLSH